MDSSLASSLYETPIEKFITRDVGVVRLNDPVTVAIEKYKSSPYHAVLIEDQSGKLVGLLTDGDLTKLLGASPESAVEAIATTGEIVAIKKEANLGQLLTIMNSEGTSPIARRLIPVVDDQHHPIGIVIRENLRADIAETMLQKATAV